MRQAVHHILGTNISESLYIFLLTYFLSLRCHICQDTQTKLTSRLMIGISKCSTAVSQATRVYAVVLSVVMI